MARKKTQKKTLKTNYAPVIQKLGQVTTESVFKHTGRHWDEWVVILDKAGARLLTHKEIAAILSSKFKLPAWWQFCVALGYQYHAGLKSPGVNAKGLYTVGLSKTLPVSNRKLWRWMTSDVGQSVWIRPLAPFEIKKGAQFEVDGGIFGEVRTFKTDERMRLTWQDTEWLKPTILEIMIHKRPGEKSVLGISHAGIKDSRDKEMLKEMWRSRLIEINEALVARF